MSQTLEVSEESWIRALLSILEDMDPYDYSKLLLYLEKIPEVKQKKSKSSMPEMAKTIIKHYGLLESISVVDNAMRKIPRMDQRIQDNLRPFVDYLNEQENQNQNQDQDKEQNQDQGKRPLLESSSCQTDNVNIPASSSDGPVSQDRKAPWKSISEVKSSGDLAGVAFRGRIIQKSVLRQGKNKKFYFYVAAADETACVRPLLFGKDRHRSIKEGHSYLFSRCVIEDGDVKVRAQSKVNETKSIIVPEDVQLEARHLIHSESPVCSIKDVKGAMAKTEVTVEGKVTAIDLAENVKVSYQQKKIKRQKFELRDETDTITICMWDEGTHEMDGLSVGDDVKVTNVKVNQYLNTVSLNSTKFTKIHKVKSVGKQEERISIEAVIKTTKKEIHLEVDLKNELRELVVAPRLLAKAFGFKLDGGVRDWLLEHLPLSANVQIQGCKITEITAAS